MKTIIHEQNKVEIRKKKTNSGAENSMNEVEKCKREYLHQRKASGAQNEGPRRRTF